MFYFPVSTLEVSLAHICEVSQEILRAILNVFR